MLHRQPRSCKRCLRLALSAIALSTCALCRAQEADVGGSERSRWVLQLSGFTHHFQGTHRRAHPSWNETNTGIGLQYDPDAGAPQRWATVWSVGEMKDSYDVIGPYAGVARLYRLNEGRIRVRLGGGAFLAWRALDWDNQRRLTLLVMPVLSVEDKKTGLGFNVTGSPSIRYDNRKIVPFVFIQGSYRF